MSVSSRASAPAVKTVALASALLCLMAVASGCGYALSGRGSFLPDYIRIVGIPAFENKTTIPEVDRILTEAVRVEFAGRGRYTIKTETGDVDAILTGTITGVRFDATAFTSNSQAARQNLIVTATIEFRDLRTNKVLWANPAMQYTEQFDVATTATGADAATFLGRDTAAMRRLSENFARSVVTSILEAF